MPYLQDFPDELLFLIRDTPNLAKSIHIPAQSGSTTNLERMQRGYSRECYISLIDRIREIIPSVGLSSDFIAGFCGETEEEHRDTLSLLEHVKYEQAFMFAYSLREKTKAHRSLQDDVPEEVKAARLQEVIATFQRVKKAKIREHINTYQCVLIEGPNKKEKDSWLGRADNGLRVIVRPHGLQPEDSSLLSGSSGFQNGSTPVAPSLAPGSLVLARITDSHFALYGTAVAATSLSGFERQRQEMLQCMKH